MREDDADEGPGGPLTPEPDPWAPGGTMSGIASGSTSRFVFASQNSGDVGDQHPTRRPRGSRRLIVVAAVAAAALVIGATIVARTSNDDATQPSATSILPSAPPNPAALDPVDGESGSSTTLLPSTEAEGVIRPVVPRDFVIAVDEDLGSLTPTQIVALSDTAGLYTISLPSGRVRVTDLDVDPSGAERAELAVNEDITVVWPTVDGGAQIVGVDRSAIVPRVEVDGVSSSPGSGTVVLWTGDSGLIFSLEASRYITTPVGFGDGADENSTIVDFDGSLLQSDTGGTYRRGASGFERLSTGDIVATGRNHLLLRECDAALICTVASLGRDGSVTKWPIDLPTELVAQLDGGLSPDGSALILRGDQTGSGAPRELYIVELADGTMQTSSATLADDGVGAWSMDSTGVFFAVGRLLLIDRQTGNARQVLSDLPDTLRGVGSRPPLLSPVCELLEVTQPRFAAMREASGDLSPPAIEVLDRLVEFAPTELAADIEPLVRFLSVFVSAETADSQQIVNWPANVRAGVDALDSYAAGTC